MIIICVLVVLIILSLAYDVYGDSYGEPGFMLAILFGMVLVFTVISIPISRMSYRAGIAEFISVQATFTNARNLNRGLENAAIQMKVAESNAWLANSKYYNGTLFDLWVPDEVTDLQPIK